MRLLLCHLFISENKSDVVSNEMRLSFGEYLVGARSVERRVEAGRGEELS